MKIIVVGFGRMGSDLALTQERQGELVTIVDNSPEKIRLMEPRFRGTRIQGMGYDKEILERAGIERADALVACTSSDETNALIARIARNLYRVPRVIARLYDVQKAAIYNALGIQTVSPIAWGVRRAGEALAYRQMDTVLEVGNGDVRIVRFEIPLELSDTSVGDIARSGEATVLSVTRENKSFIPTYGTALKRGDVLHIAVLASAASRLADTLGL